MLGSLPQPVRWHGCPVAQGQAASPWHSVILPSVLIAMPPPRFNVSLPSVLTRLTATATAAAATRLGIITTALHCLGGDPKVVAAFCYSKASIHPFCRWESNHRVTLGTLEHPPVHPLLHHHVHPHRPTASPPRHPGAPPKQPEAGR